jgi:choline dehydrogenase
LGTAKRVFRLVKVKRENAGDEQLKSLPGASITPPVTTGNTMATCVIIGERAGEILKLQHKL